MENIVLICTLLVTNLFYLGITIYILGVLVQALVSAYFIRKRKETLIDDYGFPAHRLTRLWIFSSLAWPVAWYYGIKAFFNFVKVWRVRRNMTEEEEYEQAEDYEDQY